LDQNRRIGSVAAASGLKAPVWCHSTWSRIIARDILAFRRTAERLAGQKLDGSINAIFDVRDDGLMSAGVARAA